MNSDTQSSLFFLPAVILAALAAFLTPSCFESAADAASATALAPEVEELPDSEIAPFQDELLGLAIAAASAIPGEPHVKDRSRAQADVVKAALDLGQSSRAREYADSIANWRRGLAFADIAQHCAENGSLEVARALLGLAGEYTEADLEEYNQAWRRDRIRAAVARTLIQLGDEEQAAGYELGLVDSENGVVLAAHARAAATSDYAAQLEALREELASGDFDVQESALQTCAVLFDKFYEISERRSEIEQLAKSSWGKLPPTVRVETMLSMTEAAVSHQDLSKAVSLVDEAASTVNEFNWYPEDRISLVGRIASARFAAGQKEAAMSEVAAGMDLYDANREKIGTVFRSGALRALAEAYANLGQADLARNVYKQAALTGLENPNARPRAIDLSATCASMATSQIEPDTYLWTLLREGQLSLKAPW